MRAECTVQQAWVCCCPLSRHNKNSKRSNHARYLCCKIILHVLEPRQVILRFCETVEFFLLFSPLTTLRAAKVARKSVRFFAFLRWNLLFQKSTNRRIFLSLSFSSFLFRQYQLIIHSFLSNLSEIFLSEFFYQILH